MRKLSREEKILIISDKLMAFDDELINAEAVKRATQIEYALYSLEINQKIWGKFWDEDGYCYGMLENIDNHNTYSYKININNDQMIFKNFIPMTPDEIAADIKIEIEKDAE